MADEWYFTVLASGGHTHSWLKVITTLFRNVKRNSRCSESLFLLHRFSTCRVSVKMKNFYDQ